MYNIHEADLFNCPSVHYVILVLRRPIAEVPACTTHLRMITFRERSATFREGDPDRQSQLCQDKTLQGYTKNKVW